jgi:hypothetical protein
VDAPRIPLPKGWKHDPKEGRFFSGQMPSVPALGDWRVDHHAVVFPTEEITLLCTASEGVLQPMRQEHGGLFFVILPGAVDREEAFDRVVQWESRGRSWGIGLGVLLVVGGLALIGWQRHLERTQLKPAEPTAAVESGRERSTASRMC